MENHWKNYGLLIEVHGMNELFFQGRVERGSGTYSGRPERGNRRLSHPQADPAGGLQGDPRVSAAIRDPKFQSRRAQGMVGRPEQIWYDIDQMGPPVKSN